MASKRTPAAESEFLEGRLLVTGVPNPASRYAKMVTRQKELMFKCVFQGVPAPALPWAEGWRPEPAWLSQGAETPAPLPASPAGQIELL